MSKSVKKGWASEYYWGLPSHNLAAFVTSHLNIPDVLAAQRRGSQSAAPAGPSNNSALSHKHSQLKFLGMLSACGNHTGDNACLQLWQCPASQSVVCHQRERCECSGGCNEEFPRKASARQSAIMRMVPSTLATSDQAGGLHQPQPRRNWTGGRHKAPLG